MATLFLCRLCNICGPHETDLFNGHSDELRKTISKLYLVEVEETDESTKICAKCFDTLSEYAKKRKICATTDRLMQANDIDETSDVAARVAQLDADDAVSVIDLTVPDAPQDSSVCISLLDSDSDAENDEVVADAEADQVRNTNPANSETNAPAPINSFPLQSAAARRTIACAAKENHSRARSVLLGFEGRRAFFGDEMEPAHHGTTAVVAEEPSEDCQTRSVVNKMLLTTVMEPPPDENPPNLEMDANAGTSETPNGNVTTSPLEECPTLETASSQCDEDTEPTPGANLVASDMTESQNGSMGGRVMRSSHVESTAVDKHNSKRAHVKCCHSNCNKLFKSEKAMQEHVASYHRKETRATFKCRFCQITFRRVQAQQRHMQVRHSSSSRFKCPIPNCSKSFGKQAHLERHTAEMHPDDEPPPLKQLTKSNKTHPPKRSREKVPNDPNRARKLRFECQFSGCTSSFTRPYDLKRHINGAHTKEIVYECTICPETFYFPYEVKRHTKRMHIAHK